LKHHFKMPKILIVNNAEPGITEFTETLEKIVSDAGAVFFCIQYKQCNSFNFDEFDGIILTGSPQGNDIVEHHSQYFHWIKTFEKPVLGICAGHHITGFYLALKYYAALNPNREIMKLKL